MSDEVAARVQAEREAIATLAEKRARQFMKISCRQEKQTGFRRASWEMKAFAETIRQRNTSNK